MPSAARSRVTGFRPHPANVSAQIVLCSNPQIGTAPGWALRRIYSLARDHISCSDR